MIVKLETVEFSELIRSWRSNATFTPIYPSLLKPVFTMELWLFHFHLLSEIPVYESVLKKKPNLCKSSNLEQIFFLVKIIKIWPTIFSLSRNTFSTCTFIHVFSSLSKPNFFKLSASVSPCNWSFQSVRGLGLFSVEEEKEEWTKGSFVEYACYSQLAHLFRLCC